MTSKLFAAAIAAMALWSAPPAHAQSFINVLTGSIDEIVDDLRTRRERWGFSYYVIFEPYIDAFAPVVARLAGT